MLKSSQKKSLYDAYRFPGFTPVRELRGRFGDGWARVIRLNRRSKKRSAAPAGPFIAVELPPIGPDTFSMLEEVRHAVSSQRRWEAALPI